MGLWRDVIMFVSRIPDAKDAITYIVQPQTYEHKLANSILKIIIRPSHHTAWQMLSRVYECVLLVNRLTHSIPSEVRSNLGCNVCLLILMYDEKINSIMHFGFTETRLNAPFIRLNRNPIFMEFRFMFSNLIGCCSFFRRIVFFRLAKFGRKRARMKLRHWTLLHQFAPPNLLLAIWIWRISFNEFQQITS